MAADMLALLQNLYVITPGGTNVLIPATSFSTPWDILSDAWVLGLMLDSSNPHVPSDEKAFDEDVFSWTSTPILVKYLKFSEVFVLASYRGEHVIDNFEGLRLKLHEKVYITNSKKRRVNKMYTSVVLPGPLSIKSFLRRTRTDYLNDFLGQAGRNLANIGRFIGEKFGVRPVSGAARSAARARGDSSLQSSLIPAASPDDPDDLIQARTGDSSTYLDEDLNYTATAPAISDDPQSRTTSHGSGSGLGGSLFRNLRLKKRLNKPMDPIQASVLARQHRLDIEVNENANVVTTPLVNSSTQSPSRTGGSPVTQNTLSRTDSRAYHSEVSHSDSNRTLDVDSYSPRSPPDTSRIFLQLVPHDRPDTMFAEIGMTIAAAHTSTAQASLAAEEPILSPKASPPTKDKSRFSFLGLLSSGKKPKEKT
jgi:hypothetical protein